jgi:iron complex outermembrane receptor protein
MKLKYYLLTIFLLFINFTIAKSQNTLQGKITDIKTSDPLPGVIVYITQLKLGVITDSSGKYTISSLPKGEYSVEVRSLSYTPVIKKVFVNRPTVLNFSLSDSSVITREVVITALGNESDLLHTPEPVTLVSHIMLTRESSGNIIDAISTLPGLSEITTGPGVSKPEINGLGYNRVLTLLDGIRQEDFQWGDEHGILIDPCAVYDAEIIRGPASLQYGANAMAGVISFKSQPFSGNVSVKGNISSEYQSNNGLVCNSVNIGGMRKGFAWDLRASNEQAHCYSDPADGYVWGTAYNQSNVRAVFALYKPWGYSRLTISLLHKEIEIPDGNRDSASRKFEFDTPQPLPGQGSPQYYSSGPLTGQLIPGTGKVYPDNSNFLSYNTHIPGYQILDHDLIALQNRINTGKGNILADIAFTMSHRQEIDTGVVAEEDMLVKDIPYSIKYQIEYDSSGIKLTTGINGMYEFMKNAPEPSSPYIGDFEIPDYDIFDAGGFCILEKDFKKITLSGGLRYDLRFMTGQPMYLANYGLPNQTEVPRGTPGEWVQFLPFNRSFSGFSGSLGATFQLTHNYYLKLNLAKSFRAPAINELTSNDDGLGEAGYILGNPDLKPEEGFQTDLIFGENGKNINYEVDGFCNYINNFIFYNRITNSMGGDTSALGKSIFEFKANTAIITGVSAYLNIHPEIAKWVELENGFTFIYNFLPGQTDSTEHIPFTPAPRLTSDLKFNITDSHFSILKNTYFRFGLTKYRAQNNIYRASFTELPSTAYTVINAGFGTNFANRKTSKIICSFYINVINLMNIAYVDHTSRTQYFWTYNSINNPTNYGVNSAIVTKQNEGIYNMGRNIGFKVVFPLFTIM